MTPLPPAGPPGAHNLYERMDARLPPGGGGLAMMPRPAPTGQVVNWDRHGGALTGGPAMMGQKGPAPIYGGAVPDWKEQFLANHRRTFGNTAGNAPEATGPPAAVPAAPPQARPAGGLINLLNPGQGAAGWGGYSPATGQGPTGLQMLTSLMGAPPQRDPNSGMDFLRWLGM